MGGRQDAVGAWEEVNKARGIGGVSGGRTHNIRDSMQKGAEITRIQEGQPGLVHTDPWP